MCQILAELQLDYLDALLLHWPVSSSVPFNHHYALQLEELRISDVWAPLSNQKGFTMRMLAWVCLATAIATAKGDPKELHKMQAVERGELASLTH